MTSGPTWPERQTFLTPSFTGNGFRATDIDSVRPETGVRVCSCSSCRRPPCGCGSWRWNAGDAPSSSA